MKARVTVGTVAALACTFGPWFPAALRASVDRRPAVLDQAGRRVAAVEIPALWREGKTPVGHNGGVAGIAFFCFDRRDRVSSESAANVRVALLSHAGPEGRRGTPAPR